MKSPDDDLSTFKALIINQARNEQKQKMQPKKAIRTFLNNPKQRLTLLRMNPAAVQEM